ncbi:hypothetical protein EVAR_64099_1 [Eumeta japonica]|uniref:Uncharacterized protein n=1 Tax=Eumeta variegata TaxID=151549 RepID=A0A4C1ZGM9_EUMVA|nr:hypothetical protein EVAR_64099_1 [Eumeta japonica]
MLHLFARTTDRAGPIQNRRRFATLVIGYSQQADVNIKVPQLTGDSGTPVTVGPLPHKLETNRHRAGAGRGAGRGVRVTSPGYGPRASILRRRVSRAARR